jgi:hypothetical protein
MRRERICFLWQSGGAGRRCPTRLQALPKKRALAKAILPALIPAKKFFERKNACKSQTLARRRHPDGSRWHDVCIPGEPSKPQGFVKADNQELTPPREHSSQAGVRTKGEAVSIAAP